jgi:YggT family protein
MLILLNVLRAFALILDSIITIYLVVLFARVILSWIRLPYNPIVPVIYKITEPVLGPIRRKLPMTWGIDFSPMVVFLLLFAIRIVVVGSIVDYVELYRARYLRP